MILVLSGTKDGREIIKCLLETGYKVVATTATSYGGKLVDADSNLTVISKRLDKEEMHQMIKQYNIKAVIDATHPYAIEVSKNIIEVTENTQTPYLRYERKSGNYEGVKHFPSYLKAAQWLKGKKGNVLLTTGSNHLEVFTTHVDINKLCIRVLPTASVIEKCRSLGFLPKQIIALQGPFSTDLNKAIYNQYEIKYMVTKDSGDIGGTKEKVNSALEMGIEVLMIDRPKLDYNKVVNDIEGVKVYINKVINDI